MAQNLQNFGTLNKTQYKARQILDQTSEVAEAFLFTG